MDFCFLTRLFKPSVKMTCDVYCCTIYHISAGFWGEGGVVGDTAEEGESMWKWDCPTQFESRGDVNCIGVMHIL